MLAARGSTDPDGHAEVAKVVRLLWERRGYASLPDRVAAQAGGLAARPRPHAASLTGLDVKKK